MTNSYKQSRKSEKEAQLNLRNKEFLAAKREQQERREWLEQQNLREYLKLKGELEDSIGD